MFQTHAATLQLSEADPSLSKPTQVQTATSQSTIALSSLSVSTPSSFIENDESKKGVDTPIPVTSHPDSTVLRKKQLHINYTLVSSFEEEKNATIPRSFECDDSGQLNWQNSKLEHRGEPEKISAAKKVAEWLQKSSSLDFKRGESPPSGPSFYTSDYDDSDEEFYDGYVEDSIMVEDEAQVQADSPPRSPAPITVHVHAPESTHVKPALKTSNSQDEFDRDLGRPLSNMQFLNASNINKAHNHLDAIPSNESSILNDQEFQELQQALQLSLQEAREHAGHGPNHVSFVPKDEVIPSSGEPSETQDSVAGSVADYEECIAEAKRRTSSQLVVDADYYDEEEALLKAIEISRREFEEKLRGDDGIPAGCCSGRLADDCLGACGGACGSMQIVSEEEHDKHWKGKERAYY